MVAGVVLFSLKTLVFVSFDLGSLLTWEVKPELSMERVWKGALRGGPAALCPFLCT